MRNEAPTYATALSSCRQRFPSLTATAIHGIKVFADNSSRSQMPDVTLAAIQEQLVCNETNRGGEPNWDSQRAARMAGTRSRPDDCSLARHHRRLIGHVRARAVARADASQLAHRGTAAASVDAPDLTRPTSMHCRSRITSLRPLPAAAWLRPSARASSDDWVRWRGDRGRRS